VSAEPWFIPGIWAGTVATASSPVASDDAGLDVSVAAATTEPEMSSANVYITRRRVTVLVNGFFSGG